jgi:hypothetical protein
LIVAALGCEKGDYQPIIQISADGFPAYPVAVDLVFGPYAKLGVLVKDIDGSGNRKCYGLPQSEIKSICTSHIERHNLTIRTLMKRFTRRSLGYSKNLEHLVSAVSIFMVYYNWVWRWDDAVRKRRRPPAAMLAGVVDRLWKFEDMYEAVSAV